MLVLSEILRGLREILPFWSRLVRLGLLQHGKRGGGTAYAFTVIGTANVNFAKGQGPAGADQPGGYQAILIGHWAQKNRVELHGGAGLEFAKVIDQGQHHGGVGSGHQGLAAQLVARARQTRA